MKDQTKNRINKALVKASDKTLEKHQISKILETISPDFRYDAKNRFLNEFSQSVFEQIETERFQARYNLPEKISAYDLLQIDRSRDVIRVISHVANI